VPALVIGLPETDNPEGTDMLTEVTVPEPPPPLKLPAPELFAFVKETQSKGPKFSNYDHDKLEYFAKRVYELRKD
jgi:hypothetical protein